MSVGLLMFAMAAAEQPICEVVRQILLRICVQAHLPQASAATEHEITTGYIMLLLLTNFHLLIIPNFYLLIKPNFYIFNTQINLFFLLVEEFRVGEVYVFRYFLIYFPLEAAVGTPLFPNIKFWPN